MAARAFTVGSAGVVYLPNPVVASALSSIPLGAGVAGRELDATLAAGVSARAPQSLRDFVRMYASPDGRGGVCDYLGADEFLALQGGRGLDSTKSRMVHAFWVYSSLCALAARTAESLARFEGANPGRGDGTVLNTLARATHEAWLAGEKLETSYTPYTQDVHDLITTAIRSGYLSDVDISTHFDPTKKFRVKPGQFKFPDARTQVEFAAHFNRVVGRALDSGFVINTVGGEWLVLLGIRVPENMAWALERGAFLFGLQAKNVGAVLHSLEQDHILRSIGTGSPADRIQSLVEMLRTMNVAWRPNNPWGGINSPLIGKPFALAEDGGIGIGDILKDARTLRATLTELEAARLSGRVNLPPTMVRGLAVAFQNDLLPLLDALVDQAVLEEAVRINTGFYRMTSPIEERPATAAAPG
jgi:hypothetical protein